MKAFMTVIFCVAALGLLPATATSEPVVLAERVPKWNVGDTWTFRTEKDLDRTVTQGTGLFEVSMKLNRVENTMTYAVAGTANAEGEA